jgi:hypothetical protein
VPISDRGYPIVARDLRPAKVWARPSFLSRVVGAPPSSPRLMPVDDPT